MHLRKNTIRLIGLAISLVIIGTFSFQTLKQEKERAQVVRVKHEPFATDIKLRSSASPHASIEAKKARSEYFKNRYLDPETGEIPSGAGIFDLQLAQEIDQQSPARKSNVTLSWDHAGPNNVGGRTRALAADKDNPDVLMAGAVAGGIWKSEDAGQSWRQVASTNLLPGITSIAQDPRPGFRNNWYAVGGEHDGSSSPFRDDNGTHYNTGYLESNDGGETWTYKDMFLLGQGAGTPYQWSRFGLNSRVIVHPSSGQLFFATNGFGVHRTGGQARILQETLDNQLYPRYSDVNVNANGVLLQYISGANASSSSDYTPGFYVSWDNGRNWNPIEIPGFDASDKRRGVIEFTHTDPNMAYALVQDENGELDSGVDEVLLFRLTINPSNFTVSAQDLSNFLPDQIAANDDDLGRLSFNAQGNYNLALAVHPANENTIFVGLTNLYRIRNVNAAVNISNNTALKDVVIGGYGIDTFFYNNQHPDHHLMIFPDPENRPNYMIAANDGGIYSTLDVTKTGEVDWEDLNFGYNVTQFYHTSISPRNGQDQFIAGAQDNGTPFVLVDHSVLANQSLGDVSSGDGSFGYLGRNYLYASSQNGRLLRYSLGQNLEDDGISFSGFSYIADYDGFLANTSDNPGDGGRSFIHPFAVDRANHQVMYYPAGSSSGAGYQVFRNTQITNSIAAASVAWAPIPNYNPGAIPTALATSTVPENRLIVGTSDYDRDSRSYQNGLVVIENAHTTEPTIIQRNLLNTTNGGLFSGNISQIAVNPENADEFIVVFSNYNVESLAYTSDNGETFTSIEGNLGGNTLNPYGLSIRTANILPLDGQILYLIGTSAGLYATSTINGRDTEWTKEAPDMIASIPINWIESRPSDGMILVATHGQGAFWTKAGAFTSTPDEQQLPLAMILDQNYPNPFNPETTIRFSISQPTEVRLSVYNSNGQLVQNMLKRRMSAGTHTYRFNGGNLNSGIYFIRLQGGEKILTKKMTLIK